MPGNVKGFREVERKDMGIRFLRQMGSDCMNQRDYSPGGRARRPESMLIGQKESEGGGKLGVNVAPDHYLL